MRRLSFFIASNQRRQQGCFKRTYIWTRENTSESKTGGKGRLRRSFAHMGAMVSNACSVYFDCDSEDRTE